MAQPGAHAALDCLTDLVRLTAAGHLSKYGTVPRYAIGCTGGKHRSVTLAVLLAERLTAAGDFAVEVTHLHLTARAPEGNPHYLSDVYIGVLVTPGDQEFLRE